MEEEEKILRKIKDLYALVGALAGQMCEINYRMGKLKKRKHR